MPSWQAIPSSLTKVRSVILQHNMPARQGESPRSAGMICIAPCRSPSVRFVRALAEPAMVVSCVNGDSDNLTPYCLYLLAKCQNQAWQKCGHKTPCLASWHGVLLNTARDVRQHGTGCCDFLQWKSADLARRFLFQRSFLCPVLSVIIARTTSDGRQPSVGRLL